MSQPLLRFSRALNPRIITPAVASSARASATSATTRLFRRRWVPRPEVDPRVCCFSVVTMSPREAIQAGTRPKSRPLSSETRNAPQRTGPFIWSERVSVEPMGMDRPIRSLDHFPTSTPRTPPLSASTMDSVS